MTVEESLLAFIAEYTKSAKHGEQMELSRPGPDTYPDPDKTSWNDMVSWKVVLTFGHGYFSGVVVRYIGTWTVPHNGTYAFNEAEKETLMEDGVKQFLSPELPDWA